MRLNVQKEFYTNIKKPNRKNVKIICVLCIYKSFLSYYWQESLCVT